MSLNTTIRVINKDEHKKPTDHNQDKLIGFKEVPHNYRSDDD